MVALMGVVATQTDTRCTSAPAVRHDLVTRYCCFRMQSAAMVPKQQAGHHSSRHVCSAERW
jgi:hypothetical protein